MDLIQIALHEDMPSGDITTESLALAPRAGTSRLVAKQDLVLSGRLLFEQTVWTLEPNVDVKWQCNDGDWIEPGTVVAQIYGDLMQVLKAERVALNFIGHFSGIATLTRKFVNAVAHTKTKIIDTRKTTPGLRELQKRAVRHGGGDNHRLNLSEAILLKDNHIRVAGGLTRAVERVRNHSRLPIEVEAGNLNEVQEAVSLGVNRILLDNMSNDLLKKALALIPDEIQTEASGNMTLERVPSVAELGVDFISVGALTHSAPVADFSLQFDWGAKPAMLQRQPERENG